MRHRLRPPPLLRLRQQNRTKSRRQRNIDSPVILLVALILLGPGLLSAAQQTGSVRAADQFIPGATVTARNGGARIVTYTDETGRYVLDLLPGVWEIQIEMFGFAPLHSQIDVGVQPENHDWTLEMPRLAQPAPAPAKPAAPASRTATRRTAAAEVLPAEGTAKAASEAGIIPRPASAPEAATPNSHSSNRNPASRTCPSPPPKRARRTWPRPPPNPRRTLPAPMPTIRSWSTAA